MWSEQWLSLASSARLSNEVLSTFSRSFVVFAYGVELAGDRLDLSSLLTLGLKPEEAIMIVASLHKGCY